MNDLKAGDSIHQAQQEDSSSTLINYDKDYVPRALSNGEGMRESILILILNIFEYRTPDPFVRSIHLHS